MSNPINEIFVTTVPWRDHIARIKDLSATDPDSVFFAQVLPRGYDADADRLRAQGLVQVFKRRRPVKVRELDKRAHRLVRKG